MASLAKAVAVLLDLSDDSRGDLMNRLSTHKATDPDSSIGVRIFTGTFYPTPRAVKAEASIIAL